MGHRPAHRLTVRWGIAGTGIIAAAFVAAAAEVEDAEIVAVSSGSAERAAAFATRHGIATAVPGHLDLAAMGGLDALYVATTNDLHPDVSIAALRRGIAVLCEKPVALDAASARAMVAASRDAGVFFMEAMWMVFQPSFLLLRRLLEEGTIGEPGHISADFGFVERRGPGRRWLEPRQGGGSLLDVGIYPVTLARAVLGPVATVDATGVIGPTGVDLQVAMALGHAGGGTSSLASSLMADMGVAATVSGGEGHITLHSPFHHSPRVTVHRGDDLVAEHDTSYPGSGYRWEIEEVHRCLAAGRIESEVVPHAATIEVMDVLDRVRERIGLEYPA